MAREDPGLPLQAYPVWDVTTRWFHWINVLSVLLLSGVGVVILNAGTLGVSGEGKVLLKSVHAWTGYVFALNLFWRIVWGFFGGHYAHWSAVLPVGGGWFLELKLYLRGLLSGNEPHYRGHNPLGRLMIGVLFLLLGTQMVTGLVLAGTDLYMPPFGHEFAEWATGAGEDHSKLVGLKPGQKELLDPEGYAAMREFRAPFINFHKWSFFALMGFIPIHIAAAVFTDIRERSGLISAMFTGSKFFARKPRD
ncbi:MAG: cytochrome b/b6 domain-containing protein [Haliea sp.]